MKKLIVTALVFCLISATSGCGVLQPVSNKHNKNSFYIIWQARNPDESDLDAKMEAAKAIMLYNLSSCGLSSATVSCEGKSRLRVEIPDVEKPDEIVSKVSKIPNLEFLDPSGLVILSGPGFINASPATRNGKYVVKIKLNENATEAFKEAVEKLNGRAISISLDGKIISSPNIMLSIKGNECYIECNFTQTETKQLATLLECGALPPDMVKVESGIIK